MRGGELIEAAVPIDAFNGDKPVICTRPDYEATVTAEDHQNT